MDVFREAVWASDRELRVHTELSKLAFAVVVPKRQAPGAPFKLEPL